MKNPLMTARHAEDRDIPELKALWKEAFGDDDEYIDLFFSDLFRPEDMAVGEYGGRIVSMAALLPCTLVLGEAQGRVEESCRFPISYLYAMATAKADRGRGFGLALLRFAAEYCRSRGDCGIALLPADEGLHRFYALAGYRKAFTLRPRTDNYIDYTPAYLDHCRAQGDKAADSDECGVFLPLAELPGFTAYMGWPME